MHNYIANVKSLFLPLSLISHAHGLQPLVWPGSLFSALGAGGLGSWAPVIGTLGTDGTFVGLADCAGRD